MENSTERERFYGVSPHDRPIREPISVEDCAAWIEQAEVLLPIEDYMGTKTDLTAKFALALARQMRQELGGQI